MFIVLSSWQSHRESSLWSSEWMTAPGGRQLVEDELKTWRWVHWYAAIGLTSTHRHLYYYSAKTRAVRRRTGGRRWRWVVLWPSAASDRTREHWNSALAKQAFFSGYTGVGHFTCDLSWAAGAEELTVNMHAVHDFTVVMSELFIA